MQLLWPGRALGLWMLETSARRQEAGTRCEKAHRGREARKTKVYTVSALDFYFRSKPYNKPLAGVLPVLLIAM